MFVIVVVCEFSLVHVLNAHLKLLKLRLLESKHLPAVVLVFLDVVHWLLLLLLARHHLAHWLLGLRHWGLLVEVALAVLDHRDQLLFFSPLLDRGTFVHVSVRLN